MQIKHGCSRTCLLVSRYAIKIPSFHSWKHFLRGLLNNINERNYWKWSLKDQFAKSDILCPITFSIPGGWLLVMKRCEDINLADFKEALVLKLLFNELKAAGISDLKRDNCGYLDGRIVCFDYAQ